MERKPKVGRAVPSAPIEFTNTAQIECSLNRRGALGTACPTSRGLGDTPSRWAAERQKPLPHFREEACSMPLRRPFLTGDARDTCRTGDPPRTGDGHGNHPDTHTARNNIHRSLPPAFRTQAEPRQLAACNNPWVLPRPAPDG